MISLHLFRVMDAQLIRHGSAAHVLWRWMWASMTLVYRIPFWSSQIVLDHFCSRPPHRRTFAGALWNLLLSWAVLNELHPDTLLWGKWRFVIRGLLKENSIPWSWDDHFAYPWSSLTPGPAVETSLPSPEAVRLRLTFSALICRPGECGGLWEDCGWSWLSDELCESFSLWCDII